MSSGKLQSNIILRGNKINPVRVHSDLTYLSNDTEIAWNPSLGYLSRKNHKLFEFYHKAFEIHLHLLRNENLTNNEKLNWCKLERNYIKLYLKAIMKKNYI